MNEFKMPVMTPKEEELFAIELKGLYRSLGMFNPMCGKTRDIFIRRDKILHWVFFVNNYIIFVNYGIDSEERTTVNKKIKNLVEKSMLNPLLNDQTTKL